MSICLFVLFLVLQSPVKPDGKGAQANDTGKRKTSIEWANWFLVGVGALTGYAIWRQAQIAKDTLIAQQRPRLTIKHVFITPPADITQLGDSREWKVGCVIANIGGSKAGITDSNLTIRFLGIGSVEGLLPAMPVYENRYSFEKFTVQPGERRSMDATLDTNTDGNRLRFIRALARKVDAYGQIKPDNSPTICYGYFKYRDDSGIERLSGFGCQWNRVDMSFARLDNPDYNYED